MDAGMQCYEKEEGWAECKADCTKGPDLRGPDSTPWSCKKLGSRAPGEAPSCGGPGQDCVASKCCNATGYTCFEKMPGSAKCKASCTPGPDPTDHDDSQPWSCKKLGKTTPGVAEWAKTECAAGGAEC